jgi:hypothetical protein
MTADAYRNIRFDAWREAIAANDTFRFDKVGGGRALLRRIWLQLKQSGIDPLSTEMLDLSDMGRGCCRANAAHGSLLWIGVLILPHSKHQRHCQSGSTLHDGDNPGSFFFKHRDLGRLRDIDLFDRREPVRHFGINPPLLESQRAD